MTTSTTTHRTAKAPVRSINSITLSWGLVSIPLSVYSSVEDTAVSRKEFFQGDPEVPVGRTPIRKDTGEPVDSHDVVRMAQASNGAWVVLTDEEIVQATQPKGMAEITTFVPLRNALARYLPENVNQVRPRREKGKVNPGAERAFSLLMAVLAEKQLCALVMVAMRSPARPALLMPNGDLILIRTSDSIREELPMPDYEPSDAELAMGAALVDAVGTSAPALVNTTAEAVQAFVDAKAGGAPAPVAPDPVIAQNSLEAQIAEAIAAIKRERGEAS